MTGFLDFGFSATTFICLAVFVICLTLPIKKSFGIFIVCAPLTTVAVGIVGNDSILLFQVLWVAVTFKVLRLRYETREPISFILFFFLIYCFVSTFFALANTDVVVINIDSKFGLIRFSYQQYTQLAYLFIALSSAWYTSYLLKMKIVHLDNVLKCVDTGLILVLIIAFLQLVVPVEYITALFRNAQNVSYSVENARISSTFQEPSILSLYLMPLVGIHLVRCLYKPNGKSITLIVLSLIVSILNNSSSAIVGLFAALVAALIVLLAGAKEKRLSYGALVGICIASIVVIFVWLSGVLFENFNTLLEKLSGGGVSGSTRLFNATFVFQIFLEHPIFGVGWGTIRCESLLVTWLAELGLVGVALFLVPFVLLCTRMLRIAVNQASQIFVYLFSATTIMFISCPEPYYLTYWIVFGCGWWLKSSQPVMAQKPTDILQSVPTKELKLADKHIAIKR